jgi:hypothetical protein
VVRCSDNVVLQDLGGSSATGSQSSPKDAAAAPNHSSGNTVHAASKFATSERSNAAFLDADELEYLTDNVSKASVSKPHDNMNLTTGSLTLRQQEKNSLFGDDTDLISTSQALGPSSSSGTVLDENDDDGDIFISSFQPSTPMLAGQLSPSSTGTFSAGKVQQQAVGNIVLTDGSVSPAPSGGWEL